MTVRIFLERNAWDEDLAFVLSRASAEAGGLLEPKMASLAYEDGRWHVLRKQAPGLAARLTGAWVRKHREEPAPAGAAASPHLNRLDFAKVGRALCRDGV